MAENKGWIKLYRQIIESEIFKKPPLYLKVWIYLLSRAQHKYFKDLKRGELWTSIPEIQEACSWYVGYRKVTPTYKEVYSVIQWLREPHERICERTTNGNTNGNMIVTTKATQGMLVKIENYNVYQEQKNYESNTEGNYERTAKELGTELEGNNINKNDKECNKNAYMSDSNEHRLAEYLYEHILKNNPKVKEPNLQKWAKTFDYILRIDKRDLDEVKRLIEFCQKHHFWYKNILSADKFRKQYDRLVLELNDTNKQQVNKRNVNINLNDNTGWNGYKKFK
ncbi:hypothetical protein DP125_06010 [Clostridium tetani]|uniref:hypothetical protein n=1 Tax=Clostridium tetani TaxID=1513 RepID=UPI001009FA10|nr:hypothetical protein [Clostridium tetani]RXI60143.1 hypothetical protein DP132_11665 [Clostridium tetani]RXI61026.1 hypothetical protein DP125_06010 [Clostridium tetani]RXI64972.1 hypothetical protein DP123_06475 [Clostridium tetani]RXI71019.1 hypothetical protein DP121_05760 [Clostridium tetani]